MNLRKFSIVILIILVFFVGYLFFFGIESNSVELKDNTLTVDYKGDPPRTREDLRKNPVLIENAETLHIEYREFHIGPLVEALLPLEYSYVPPNLIVSWKPPGSKHGHGGYVIYPPDSKGGSGYPAFKYNTGEFVWDPSQYKIGIPLENGDIIRRSPPPGIYTASVRISHRSHRLKFKIEES